MINLVLLSYGRETEYLRATCAALSFWARYAGARADVRTVIFTDNPTALQPYLAGLPIAYKCLSDSELVGMKGPQQFVHRVKVAIIDRTFREYPSDTVLYLDSDTFFTAGPRPLLAALLAGRIFMHQYEYTIAEAVGIYAGFKQEDYPRKAIARLESHPYHLGMTAVQFHQGYHNWNSGVLGLPPAVAAVMPDVYTLTDDLYANSGWIISEQLAFSLVLQAHTKLQPCSRYVYHYWGSGQKTLMDTLLRRVLNEHFSCLPLAARLARVRQLVPQWQRQLALHKIQEGALYAFAQGQLHAGLKYAAKALLADPLDVKFAKQLYLLLRNEARQRQGRLRASRR